MALDGATASFLPYTLNGIQDITVDSSTVSTLQVNSLTPNRVVVSDGSNFLVSASASSTEVDYLVGTSSNIQTQINGKASTSYVDTNFLNKTIASAQSVVSEVTFNNTVTGNYFYTDNSYNWGRQNASYNAWSIKRILNGGIIRDLQFKDETDGSTTLLLSSSGQTVYTSLTCDYGTASKIPVWDANKKLVSSGIDSIKITYLDNVSSDIQTQLNTKASTTYVDSQNSAQDLVIATKASTTYVDTQDALRVLKSGDTMSGALTVDAVVSVGNRLLGTPDGSPGNFWIGLRGSGTETDRLAISIGGVPTTGVVSGVTISKSLYLSPLTADRALYLDGSKVVTASSVTGTELGYLSGATSGLQSQINARATFTYVDTQDALRMVKAGGNVITGNQTFNDNTASTVAIFDASKNLKSSTVTTTELGYVGGVTSAIQTQLNAKASTTYVDTADALRLLKAGDTATGTIYNSGGDFWPYRGGDTNRGVKLFGKDADGATYTVYNGGLASWFGIGFECSLDSTTRFIFNTRDGNSSQTGSLTAGSASLTGKLTTVGVDTTGQININLASNTTPSIKFVNSLNHITGNASEAFLFNGQNGYLAVGRNTVRSTTEANLHMGTTGTDASIESISSDGSAYLLMTYYASQHLFKSGSVGIGTTNARQALDVTGNIVTDWAGATDRLIGEQYLTGNDYFLGLILQGNNRLTQIVSKADDNVGGVTINTGKGAVERVRVTADGSVGIGITTPSYKLHVVGDAYASGSLLFGSAGTYDTGCIYSDSNYGCLIRAEQVKPAIAIYEFRDSDGTSVMSISKNGATAINGLASNYAITSGLTTRAGAVVVGGNGTNYDDGWNTGLLMECLDTTGISIHDAGQRLSSFMYYSGNRFYMGRNPGGSWSLTPYTFESAVTFNNSVSQSFGDSSKMLFGPNATWSAYLEIGAGTNNVTASKAQIITTNGNLHIDAGLGKEIYLGYYPNLASQPNNIRTYGPLYIDNPPATTTYGSAGYGTNLGWDVLNSRVTVNVIEYYHSGPSTSYSPGNWNFVVRTNQFYKSSVSQSLWVSGYATAFSTSSANMDIYVRVYNTSTGTDYTQTAVRFTNTVNNHTVIPINMNFGFLPAGWYNVITFWVAPSQNADANDYLSLTYMLCHGIQSA